MSYFASATQLNLPETLVSGYVPGYYFSIVVDSRCMPLSISGSGING